jgi:hypothetical protein
LSGSLKTAVRDDATSVHPNRNETCKNGLFFLLSMGQNIASIAEIGAMAQREMNDR